MLDGPKQNWQLYEERCRSEHLRWLRNLTPAAALALYEDFHRIASGQCTDLERLQETRWKEKLALRRRMYAVFAALDRIRSERRDTQDAA